MALSKDQVAAIENWLDASNALKLAQKAEIEARQQLCIKVWPGTLQLGANTIELTGGGRVTVTTGWNYSFTSADAISGVLQHIEQAGEMGPSIAAGLVSWAPSLKVTGYKSLQPEYKALVDKVLITKPKMPAAEYKAPKDA